MNPQLSAELRRFDYRVIRYLLARLKTRVNLRMELPFFG